VTRPRAADDFATIRQRMEELRGQGTQSVSAEGASDADGPPPGRGLGRVDERYRDRAEGAPPPWVPTIFLR
jgi:hypothetical protein